MHRGLHRGARTEPDTPLTACEGAAAHPPSPPRPLGSRPPASVYPEPAVVPCPPPAGTRNRFVAPRCTSRRLARSTIGPSGSNRRRHGAGAAGEFVVGNVRVTLPEELRDLVRDVVADLESATGGPDLGSAEPSPRAHRRDRRRATQATILRLPSSDQPPASTRPDSPSPPSRRPHRPLRTPSRYPPPPHAGGPSWPDWRLRPPSPASRSRHEPAASRWPAGAPPPRRHPHLADAACGGAGDPGDPRHAHVPAGMAARRHGPATLPTRPFSGNRHARRTPWP